MAVYRGRYFGFNSLHINVVKAWKDINITAFGETHAQRPQACSNHPTEWSTRKLQSSKQANFRSSDNPSRQPGEEKQGRRQRQTGAHRFPLATTTEWEPQPGHRQRQGPLWKGARTQLAGKHCLVLPLFTNVKCYSECSLFLNQKFKKHTHTQKPFHLLTYYIQQKKFTHHMSTVRRILTNRAHPCKSHPDQDRRHQQLPGGVPVPRCHQYLPPRPPSRATTIWTSLFTRLPGLELESQKSSGVNEVQLCASVFELRLLGLQVTRRRFPRDLFQHSRGIRRRHCSRAERGARQDWGNCSHGEMWEAVSPRDVRALEEGRPCWRGQAGRGDTTSGSHQMMCVKCHQPQGSATQLGGVGCVRGSCLDSSITTPRSWAWIWWESVSSPRSWAVPRAGHWGSGSHRPLSSPHEVCSQVRKMTGNGVHTTQHGVARVNTFADRTSAWMKPWGHRAPLLSCLRCPQEQAWQPAGPPCETGACWSPSMRKTEPSACTRRSHGTARLLGPLGEWAAKHPVSCGWNNDDIFVISVNTTRTWEAGSPPPCTVPSTVTRASPLSFSSVPSAAGGSSLPDSHNTATSFCASWPQTAPPCSSGREQPMFPVSHWP